MEERYHPYAGQGGCIGGASGSGGGGKKPNRSTGIKRERDPTQPRKPGNNKNGAAGTDKCALCRQRKQKCNYDPSNPLLPCVACRKANVQCGPKTRASIRVNPDTVNQQLHAPVLHTQTQTLGNATARPSRHVYSYSTGNIHDRPPSLLPSTEGSSQSQFQGYTTVSEIARRLELDHPRENMFSINRRIQLVLTSMDQQTSKTTGATPPLSQGQHISLLAPQQRQLAHRGALAPPRPTSQNNEGPTQSRPPTAAPSNGSRISLPGSLSPGTGFPNATHSPRYITPPQLNRAELDGAEVRIANTGVFDQDAGPFWRWPGPEFHEQFAPQHNLNPPVVQEHAAIPDDFYTRENTVATEQASVQQTNNEMDTQIGYSGNLTPTSESGSVQ